MTGRSQRPSETGSSTSAKAPSRTWWQPRMGRTALIGTGVSMLLAAAWLGLDANNAGLSLLLVAAAFVVLGVAWLESGPDSAKELALVATLGGAAAAGRVLFAAIPGVQPVTVVAIVAGAGLGLRAGVGVGMTAAFVSNLFLAQGPWTPFQMLAWGACGAIGALLAPLLRGRVALAVVACVLGFAFSAFMDVWEWYAFWPHTWKAFVLVFGRGVPFDIAHA